MSSPKTGPSLPAAAVLLRMPEKRRKRLMNAGKNLCALILTAAVLTAGYGFRDLGRPFLKAAAGAAFVIMSVVCTLLGNGRGAARFFPSAAMVLYMIADLVIQNSFIRGAVWFAADHAVMLIGLVKGDGLHIRDAVSALFTGASVFLLFRFGPRMRFGKNAPYLIGYAVLLALTLSKALSCLLSPVWHPHGKVSLAVGMALFLLSDWCLALRLFGLNRTSPFRDLCLTIYYPAVCMLAISGLYVRKKPE